MTLEQINVAPIDRLLIAVINAGATDLMLTPYSPPRMRVDGRLRPIPGERALDPDACTNLIKSILGNAMCNLLADERELDFSFTYETTHRFRGNCFVEQRAQCLRWPSATGSSASHRMQRVR